MSSRARTRWGISLAVLVVFVVGFTSAAWRPGFAADRITFWESFGKRFKTNEEINANEPFSEKNKAMGITVFNDQSIGTVLYTLTESGAIAAVPAPNSYVFRTAKSAAGIHAYRAQAYTGEVWVWGDGDVWKQVAPPVVGRLYGVFDLVLTPVGDEGKVNLLLVQPNTGMTWWINAEGGPKKLAEPPKAE